MTSLIPGDRPVLRYTEAIRYDRETRTIRFYDEPPIPATYAACIVLVVPIDEQPHFFMTVRHSRIAGGGFTAPPGGHFDARRDGSIKFRHHTGLFETLEETGVSPEHLMRYHHVRPPLKEQVIGTGLVVTPFLAHMSPEALKNLRPDPREVETLAALPASLLYRLPDGALEKDVVVTIGPVHRQHVGARQFKVDRITLDWRDIDGRECAFRLAGPTVDLIRQVQERLPELDDLTRAMREAEKLFLARPPAPEEQRRKWREHLIRHRAGLGGQDPLPPR